MELGPTELAQHFVDLVRADDGLPRSVREEAADLQDLVEHQPDLVLARLQAMAVRYADVAPHHGSPTRLAKAVPIESFWEHYLAGRVKALFADPESYRRYLTAAPDPAQQAREDVRQDGVLIPAEYSWFAPYRDLESMSGIEVIDALELGSTRQPPVLILVLRSDGLDELGVVVREPRATDAVPARHTQWRLSGLASGIEEVIDRDVPREALSTVEWRP